MDPNQYNDIPSSAMKNLGLMSAGERATAADESQFTAGGRR
jgi:hypothetical protein